MHRQTWFRRFGMQVVAAGMLLNVALSTGCAGEIKRINVSYAVDPGSRLPPEVKVIEVDKPNYPYRATEDGICRNPELACYNQLIRQLQTRFRAAAPDVAIREREDGKTLDVLRRERDASGDPDQAPQPVVASAAIVPRFLVAADWDSYVEPPSWRERIISGAGSCVPYVGPLVPRAQCKPVQRLRVKVTCDMHLTLAGSKQMLFTYGRELEAVEQTDAGTLYGMDVRRTPAQLSSAERLAERLVQEHVDNFLSQFLHIDRTVRLDLTDVSRDAAAAIDCLNTRHTQEARNAAIAAYERKPKKEHAACFVAGLTYEIEQNWAEAVEWYGRAMSIKPLEPEYESALRRVEAMQSNTARLAARAADRP